MVIAKIIILNHKQIARLLHDYIVENSENLCFDKSITRTGSYINFSKNNSKMICLFMNNNSMVIDKNRLLDKLPHTGLHNFIMSNKQIKSLLDCDEKLGLEELCFASEDIYSKIPKNYVRLMTLNEAEMREILFKQTFQFFANTFGFGNSFNVGMHLNFNDTDSELVFYCSKESLNFDVNKLATLDFPNVKNEEYKCIDLNERDITVLINS